MSCTRRNYKINSFYSYYALISLGFLLNIYIYKFFCKRHYINLVLNDTSKITKSSLLN